MENHICFSVDFHFIAAVRKYFLHYLSWVVRDEKISCLPHEQYNITCSRIWPSSMIIVFVGVDRGFPLFVAIAQERCGLDFKGHWKKS